MMYSVVSLIDTRCSRDVWISWMLCLLNNIKKILRFLVQVYSMIEVQGEVINKKSYLFSSMKTKSHIWKQKNVSSPLFYYLKSHT